MALALFRKDEIAAVPDIEAASLRSDRFRLERETDWRRLDAIVTCLEKNRLRRISDEDLLALPVLYRQTASSLAVARETSLDAGTLAYLESLVRRAWFQVYGPRTSLFGWLRRSIRRRGSAAASRTAKCAGRRPGTRRGGRAIRDSRACRRRATSRAPRPGSTRPGGRARAAPAGPRPKCAASGFSRAR